MAKRNKPNDSERINHMLESIDKIFRYTEDLDYKKFNSDEMVQDAVIKNFEIIGEAAYHISKELKRQYDAISWKVIEGLRHVLVHDYYRVNPEILWNTKNEHLEDLQTNLMNLLEEISE